MFAGEEGRAFIGKTTFGETSDDGSALASHNGRLFLAWRGSGNEHLKVATVVLFRSTAGAFGIEGLEAKITLDETSEFRPALASHDGRLFLAWKAAGNDQLNLRSPTTTARRSAER
jgi:hypothetical protein